MVVTGVIGVDAIFALFKVFFKVSISFVMSPVEKNVLRQEYPPDDRRL
jgi:hypothetical protein